MFRPKHKSKIVFCDTPGDWLRLSSLMLVVIGSILCEIGFYSVIVWAVVKIVTHICG